MQNSVLISTPSGFVRIKYPEGLLTRIVSPQLGENIRLLGFRKRGWAGENYYKAKPFLIGNSLNDSVSEQMTSIGELVFVSIQN